MAKAKRSGRAVQVYVPDDLWPAVEALLTATGRSISDEVVHAIRRHVAAPPAIRVDVPPLAPAEIEKQAKPGRGRRKKSDAPPAEPQERPAAKTKAKRAKE